MSEGNDRQTHAQRANQNHTADVLDLHTLHALLLLLVQCPWAKLETITTRLRDASSLHEKAKRAAVPFGRRPFLGQNGGAASVGGATPSTKVLILYLIDLQLVVRVRGDHEPFRLNSQQIIVPHHSCDLLAVHLHPSA